jgi:histidinol dehydrogenase
MKSFEKGFEENGIGRWIRPLNRAGIYVPGGTALYPSTVLMTAIPASVAGVKEISMVSPPQKNGLIPAITLIAADIAGVKRIFKTGGAQAIAALAYGTETIPKVDKICGPGNIYVAVAKKLVYGIVDIDGIQGPSEVIVVGDSSAKPDYCAADLLAQAEHDSMASAIFITDSAKLAAEVKREINRQLALLHRKEILKQAIDNNCLLIIVANINEAIDLVNLYAPEHLLLMIRRAKSYLRKVQNVGCIFLGEKSPVAIGDYVAGPSHVLPTGGTARFTSALSVESFQKIINYVELAKKDQRRLARATYNIAMAEGLTAHAEAVKIRFKNII